MNEDTNIIILLSHYSANVFRITLSDDVSRTSWERYYMVPRTFC